MVSGWSPWIRGTAGNTDQAERQRSGSADAVFAQAVHAIHADLHAWSALDAATIAATYFPDAPLTIVPLAIALGTVADSAEEAILLAANIGGDSDSVASIAGAIAGARCPETINDSWYAIVERVNGHNLIPIAEALTVHRR